MTMKSVTTTECKEGDILAEDIVNMYGATIVAENTVLNSYIINRLTELGVQQVKIHDEYMETDRRNGSHIYRQIKGNYKESMLVDLYFGGINSV